MNTVNAILEIKGRAVFSIEAAQSVYEAVEKLAEKEVGALTVLDANEDLVGIISERDYARKVILKNKSSRETLVSEIMTHDVVTVADSTTVDQCMSLMSHYKIRHLPVTRGKKLLGIISVDDLLNFTIKDQTHTIESLERYIMDDRGGEG